MILVEDTISLSPFQTMNTLQHNNHQNRQTSPNSPEASTSPKSPQAPTSPKSPLGGGRTERWRRQRQAGAGTAGVRPNPAEAWPTYTERRITFALN